jgi:hypothetical protein
MVGVSELGYGIIDLMNIKGGETRATVAQYHASILPLEQVAFRILYVSATIILVYSFILKILSRKTHELYVLNQEFTPVMPNVVPC